LFTPGASRTFISLPKRNELSPCPQKRWKSVTEALQPALPLELAECASPDEIIDLLQGGQGVFGIAVGKVWHEVEGSLSLLQGEVNGQPTGVENNDELSMRRKSKGA